MGILSKHNLILYDLLFSDMTLLKNDKLIDISIILSF